MSKDAADNPYKPQHRPFVLPCGECGEVERIVMVRKQERNAHHDEALVPLCADCRDVELRVWGEERQSIFRVPEADAVTDEETGERLHVVLCPRCNGSGVTPYGWCFGCAGARFVFQSDKRVQRTARWWQTYQQNRTG